MAKTECLHIRISLEQKKQVQELADREHRTVSNYIESLILKEWDKYYKEE